MAMVMIGDPGVVHFRQVSNGQLVEFRWWAERGLIHWENQITGEYGSQTVRKTLEHLQGLNELKDLRADLILSEYSASWDLKK